MRTACEGAGGAAGGEEAAVRTDRQLQCTKFSAHFAKQDVIQPFNEAKHDAKVRAAAVVNDKDNVGKAFADKMAVHIDTIAGMGRQYFGTDKGFKSSLDRSARRAA
ncbi:hypothetical protein [Streptomyces sp. NPDC051286]|uniref:hypothetical protein n=1 Tax=Streptomyces sp. NPDC051286 TaxID=3365647 RepID=UPI00379D0F1A